MCANLISPESDERKVFDYLRLLLEILMKSVLSHQISCQCYHHYMVGIATFCLIHRLRLRMAGSASVLAGLHFVPSRLPPADDMNTLHSNQTSIGGDGFGKGTPSNAVWYKGSSNLRVRKFGVCSTFLSSAKHPCF
jgi:hypothetical protein